MDLARFPRRRYTEGWTPLEHLPRLTQFMGGPHIFIKRDDLLGLSAGGNKTRKLEFLVADALKQGADTLITCGAVQSNHCRLTLAAAVKEGLKCRLVLEQRVPGSYNPDASGNNFLFRLLGVEKVTVVDGGTDMLAAMEKEADELAAEGRKGYVIPGGGSNALGALGYVACAQEIMGQAFQKGIHFDHLVCASGSGGTHSGILVGLRAMGSKIPVTGISVSRTVPAQEALIGGLARETREFLGLPPEAASGEVQGLRRLRGAGLLHPHRRHGGGGQDLRPDRGDPPGPGLHGKGGGRSPGSDSEGLLQGRGEGPLPPHRGFSGPLRLPGRASGLRLSRGPECGHG